MSNKYDVIIIGCGMSGASLAYELSAQQSVLVVEKEKTLAYHSTGRSVATWVQSHGTDQTRLLSQASQQFFLHPTPPFPDSVAKEMGVLIVPQPDEINQRDALFERLAPQVTDLAILSVNETIDRAPYLKPDAIAGGIYEPHALALDVHSIHEGYLRGLRSRGGTVLTNAPVTKAHREHTHWRVQVGEDIYCADILVNAAAAWGDHIAECAGVKPLGLTPKLRSAFAINTPQLDTSTLPMVVDFRDRFYLKPENGQLLCSPVDQTPTEPCNAKPDDLNIARAIEEINETTTLGIRSIQTSWGGLRTFTTDENHAIGYDNNAEGFFWYVGQGGQGIETAPAAARLGAAILQNQAIPDDLAELGITPTTFNPNRFN